MCVCVCVCVCVHVHTPQQVLASAHTLAALVGVPAATGLPPAMRVMVSMTVRPGRARNSLGTSTSSKRWRVMNSSRAAICARSTHDNPSVAVHTPNTRAPRCSPDISKHTEARALNGLACRKRVAAACSPAATCKQAAALTSPARHACGCARPSRVPLHHIFILIQ